MHVTFTITATAAAATTFRDAGNTFSAVQALLRPHPL
jgi:hypothetical protein